jgi:hypothetical protein
MTAQFSSVAGLYAARDFLAARSHEVLAASIHEICHAAVGVELDAEFRQAEIFPQPGGGGCAGLCRFLSFGSAEVEATVYVAGAIGEKKLMPHRLWHQGAQLAWVRRLEGESGDLERLDELCQWERWRPQRLEQFKRNAREIIAERHCGIIAAAIGLAEALIVTAAEMKAIFKAAANLR